MEGVDDKATRKHTLAAVQSFGIRLPAEAFVIQPCSGHLSGVMSCSVHDLGRGAGVFFNGSRIDARISTPSDKYTKGK